MEAALRARIGEYATREIDDEALLRDDEDVASNDHLRCAILLRLSEKRILRAHLERLQAVRGRDEL